MRPGGFRITTELWELGTLSGPGRRQGRRCYATSSAVNPAPAASMVGGGTAGLRVRGVSHVACVLRAGGERASGIAFSVRPAVQAAVAHEKTPPPAYPQVGGVS